MKNYENGELIIDLYAVPPRVQNAAWDQVPESSLMGQTLEVSFHHIPCQNQNQWSERKDFIPGQELTRWPSYFCLNSQ